MKKLRVILSVLAIIFAASATFAMRSVMPMTAYEFIPATEGAPEQCIERTMDCLPIGPNDCTYNGRDLRKPNSQTNCAMLLKKY